MILGIFGKKVNLDLFDHFWATMTAKKGRFLVNLPKLCATNVKNWMREKLSKFNPRLFKYFPRGDFVCFAIFDLENFLERFYQKKLDFCHKWPKKPAF